MSTPVLHTVIVMAAMLLICCPMPASSYALLSHEAIVDTCWSKAIKPLLKQKYPGTSEEQLKTALAYVYGGSIISDIGYYPLGSVMFSHLVHYVRSGDFVNTLLDEAQDINEYAFALGVLCHYEADTYGHPLGTNKAVSVLFPRLREKYGNEVTFEQGKNQHGRVEFGFDVLQTARGNYQSHAYHDFIGFQIGDSVLERAFLKTYGMEMKEVFPSLPAAIAIFRFSVKAIIPEVTIVAWKIKKSFITQLNPLATEKNYYYKSDKKNYRKEFIQPKLKSILVLLIVAVLPKFGPLARFKPKIPSPEAEKLFEQSFDSIRTLYAGSVKRLHSKNISFDNVDLDTGKETTMGEYKLADKTYYKLIKKLKREKFAKVDDRLKKNIIAYYNKQDASHDYGSHTRKGKKITRALQQLNSLMVNSCN